MSARRGQAAFVVILSGLLFGTTGTATVLADTGAPATAIAAARLLLGAVGLVALAVIQRDWSRLIALWKLPLTWAMGLGVAGYMAFFFMAVAQGGVAIASLVSISLSPWLTGTIARLLGSAWPGRIWFVATTLAISGVLLLSSPSSGTSDQRALGAVFAAVASAAYALYTVLGSRLVAAHHHATDTLAASFAVGAALLLPMLATNASWLMHPRGLALTLWLGIAATTVSYSMFGYGLTHLPPGIVATLVLSEPVIATLLGVFVLDEPMPTRGWVGCGMIAIGLMLVARNEAKGRAHV